MKRYIFALIVLLSLSLSLNAQIAYHSRARDCMFTLHQGTVTRTFSLWGRVKVVKSNEYADLRVKIITNKKETPDLRVAIVKDKATRCGEWLFVQKKENFTVKFVDDFEDITIRIVQKSELSGLVPY